MYRSRKQKDSVPTDIPFITTSVLSGSNIESSPPRLLSEARTHVQTAPALTSDLLSAYIVEVEINCEECGGSGFDPGGVDPWGPEPCPKCQGAKKQRITRNYLAEAFQIAANPESVRQVERAHLVAVIHHCRETVRAVMSLPEVA